MEGPEENLLWGRQDGQGVKAFTGKDDDLSSNPQGPHYGRSKFSSDLLHTTCEHTHTYPTHK